MLTPEVCQHGEQREARGSIWFVAMSSASSVWRSTRRSATPCSIALTWKDPISDDAFSKTPYLFLKPFMRAGSKMGIVSNRLFAGERFAETLRHLGLTPFFQTVRTSCDFGFLKPHPRIFKAALRDLGVTPRRAVMVGDSLEADIEGAQVLGLRTVWRRNGGRLPGAARPDWTVVQLSDLLTISVLQESRAE